MSEPTTAFTNIYEHLAWEQMQAGSIHYNNQIDDSTVLEFVSALWWIENNTSVDPIQVTFSSGGGGVYAALGCYDGIKKCKRSVNFICTGLVASAAAMIVLQAATRRLAYKNTRFLLHEPSRWIFMGIEKASTLRDEAAELNRLVDIIVGILQARCMSKTEEEIRLTIDRKEVWMSAQEALEWGLIDEII